jgi:hypothetical protein
MENRIAKEENVFFDSKFRSDRSNIPVWNQGWYKMYGERISIITKPRHFGKSEAIRKLNAVR